LGHRRYDRAEHVRATQGAGGTEGWAGPCRIRPDPGPRRDRRHRCPDHHGNPDPGRVPGHRQQPRGLSWRGMASRYARPLGRQRGQGLVEYALILALVAVVLIAVLTLL